MPSWATCPGGASWFRPPPNQPPCLVPFLLPQHLSKFTPAEIRALPDDILQVLGACASDCQIPCWATDR